jgi:hypothetical protein
MCSSFIIKKEWRIARALLLPFNLSASRHSEKSLKKVKKSFVGKKANVEQSRTTSIKNRQLIFR